MVHNSKSNIKIVEQLQSTYRRRALDAPLYMRNTQIQRETNTEPIKERIQSIKNKLQGKTEGPPQRGTAQLNNRPLKRTTHKATTHKNHKQIGSQGIKLQLLQKTNQLGERAVRLSP
jgi:hypothetical protein